MAFNCDCPDKRDAGFCYTKRTGIEVPDHVDIWCECPCHSEKVATQLSAENLRLTQELQFLKLRLVPTLGMALDFIKSLTIFADCFSGKEGGFEGAIYLDRTQTADRAK